MMTGLGPLLASFIAMDMAAMKRKLRRNLILYGIVALLLLTTYGLLVAALAVWLGALWGLHMALLAVAGGTLVLALIVLMGVAIGNSAAERRRREAAAANSSRALAVTAAVSVLPLLMKSKPLLMLAAVGGLGFLAVKGTGTKQGPPAE